MLDAIHATCSLLWVFSRASNVLGDMTAASPAVSSCIPSQERQQRPILLSYRRKNMTRSVQAMSNLHRQKDVDWTLPDCFKMSSSQRKWEPRKTKWTDPELSMTRSNQRYEMTSRMQSIVSNQGPRPFKHVPLLPSDRRLLQLRGLSRPLQRRMIKLRFRKCQSNVAARLNR